MELKDTKIFISEIPKEWTHRIRSGHTNFFNENCYGNELEGIILEPPIKGLYAERFEDGWYWVCGCNKCLNNNKKYSYIVCEEHDRCITCGTHRKELTETPFGHPDGFKCKACVTREHEEEKNKALREAKKKGHSEYDCHGKSEIICPMCASKCSSDDLYEAGEHKVTCYVCDVKFIVEIEYYVNYTSKLKKD